MSIFGQVWLWSVAAFVVGVLLTWVLLVRPARSRVRALERRLAETHASQVTSSAVPPAPVPAPAEDDGEAFRPPPPSYAATGEFAAPGPHPTEHFAPAQEPPRDRPAEPEPQRVEFAVPESAAPEPAQPEPQRDTAEQDVRVPGDINTALDPDGRAPEPEPAPSEPEPQAHVEHPQPEPAPEPASAPEPSAEPEPDRASADQQRGLFQPAVPAEGGAEQGPPPERDVERTEVLPKRQPNPAPRGGFDPPEPIQPSMRSIPRREPSPEVAGGHSGSLFEPSVPRNEPAGQGEGTQQASFPARDEASGPGAPGPFGPGSAMPLPGGGRPSEDFGVKASVTALRYCTEGSPQFQEMVAEVWFRAPADAERVGFRPIG